MSVVEREVGVSTDFEPSTTPGSESDLGPWSAIAHLPGIIESYQGILTTMRQFVAGEITTEEWEDFVDNHVLGKWLVAPLDKLNGRSPLAAMRNHRAVTEFTPDR